MVKSFEKYYAFYLNVIFCSIQRLRDCYCFYRRLISDTCNVILRFNMYGKRHFYPSFGYPKTNFGPFSSGQPSKPVFVNTNVFDPKVTASKQIKCKSVPKLKWCVAATLRF